jgi:Glycosyltransferase family 87
MATRPLKLTVALLAATVALGALPTGAAAQRDPLVPTSVSPESLDEPPPGFRLTAREAMRIADRLPEVRRERRSQPGLRRRVEIPLYLGDARRFEVVYAMGTDVHVDVHVSGLTGEVLEAWAGPQADSLLARGYEPSIGRSLNRPYVWLPLAALFLLPFLDPRRPFRLIHLDLAVLLGFGISQLFHNRGEIELSIPIVYPLLAYLLARTLLAAFRPREGRGPLVPYARTSWLAVALVLLVAFRIGLNLADSGVVDVGYASVVGADRVAHKEELYVFNEVHGDTYGPVTYLAYLPFELLFPNDGTWGFVPAAHAAAIAFDLLTIVGLMLLGAQLRPGREGRRLGLAFAFAWAAYPFTLLVLQANTNDGLVAALVVFALVAMRSPPGRGLMLGLATAAKFAPVVMAPLLAAGTGGERRPRSWLSFAAVFAVAIALPVLLYLPDGGLREFYDATIGFQLGRESPFSLWGLHPSLSWLQDVLKLAGLALAVAAAFVPRRRDLRQVAALGAAVLIAAQLVASHWFYFYLVWIAPLVLVVVLGGYRTPERWTDERGKWRPLTKGTAASGRSPH